MNSITQIETRQAAESCKVAQTVVTFFSGGGGKALGAKLAGCNLVGAVECEADICEVYAQNVSPIITCARVETVDFRQWIGIDGAMASPVCTRASVANPLAGECEIDIIAGEATARFIRIVRPKWFFLENVYGYRRFEAFRLIVNALTECGYSFQVDHCNTADYGVPQTRKRLILQAVAPGYLLPGLPSKVVRWNGWYDAIADLLPGLEDGAFAPWQIARLGSMGRRVTEFLMMTGNTQISHPTGSGCLSRSQPSNTVATNSARNSRAWLVESDNSSRNAHDIHKADTSPTPSVTTASRPKAFVVPAGGNEDTVAARADDEPAFTVMTNGVGRTKAFVAGEVSAQGRLFEVAEVEPSLEWLQYGVVKTLDTRCLARFQTFPDSYKLPTNNELAAKIIGNAVPVKLAEQIVRRLVAATQGSEARP